MRHLVVQRAPDVQQATARHLPDEGGPVLRRPLNQGRPYLVRRARRVRGLQQGRRPRHVGGRHGGAGHPGYPDIVGQQPTLRRTGRAEDVHARRRDVHVGAAVVAEVGSEGEVSAHGPHRDHVVQSPVGGGVGALPLLVQGFSGPRKHRAIPWRRGTDLRPLVSGSDDEDDPVRIIQGLEHLPHHIPPLLFRLQDGSVPSQRGVHGRQLQVRPVLQQSDQVLDAPDHPSGPAQPLLVHGAEGDQPHVPVHAHDARAVVPLGADGPCHVGAVAVLVPPRWLARHETPAQGPVHVRQLDALRGRVDARVHHGHVDVVAPRREVPGLRRPDGLQPPQGGEAGVVRLPGGRLNDVVERRGQHVVPLEQIPHQVLPGGGAAQSHEDAVSRLGEVWVGLLHARAHGGGDGGRAERLAPRAHGRGRHPFPLALKDRQDLPRNAAGRRGSRQGKQRNKRQHGDQNRSQFPQNTASFSAYGTVVVSDDHMARHDRTVPVVLSISTVT